MAEVGRAGIRATGIRRQSTDQGFLTFAVTPGGSGCVVFADESAEDAPAYCRSLLAMMITDSTPPARRVRIIGEFAWYRTHFPVQTGARVAEPVDIRLAGIDFPGTLLTLRGTGVVERQVDLERHTIEAVKNRLRGRPERVYDRLFLNDRGGL